MHDQCIGVQASVRSTGLQTVPREGSLVGHEGQLLHESLGYPHPVEGVLVMPGPAGGSDRARIKSESSVCSGEKSLRRARAETGPDPGLGDFGGLGDNAQECRLPSHGTLVSNTRGD